MTESKVSISYIRIYNMHNHIYIYIYIYNIILILYIPSFRHLPSIIDGLTAEETVTNVEILTWRFHTFQNYLVFYLNLQCRGHTTFVGGYVNDGKSVEV